MSQGFDEIVETIRSDILMDRLELGELGVTLESITPESVLMSDTGLGLDSVDALDVLVAVQQIFAFKIETIDRAFVEAHCHTVRSLAQFVEGRLQARLAA